MPQRVIFAVDRGAPPKLSRPKNSIKTNDLSDEPVVRSACRRCRKRQSTV